MVAFAWAIIWDRGWFAYATTAAKDADPAVDGAGAWLVALTARASQSDFCVVMAVLFAVIFVYGVGQWIAGRLEASLLKGHLSGRAAVAPQRQALVAASLRAAAPGSGRPATLVQVLLGDPEIPAALDLLQHHVQFGANFLRAPLRMGVWMFPILGFLGTVVGISGAMHNLPRAVGQGAAMERVVGNLYVAFDTTFIGLVAALSIAIIDYGVASHWLDFEASLDVLTGGRADNSGAKTPPGASQ